MRELRAHGRIAQGYHVFEPGAVPPAVRYVAELPDGDAVGQVQLRSTVVRPEADGVEGVLERFSAEVMQVFLGRSGDQFLREPPGTEQFLPDHLLRGGKQVTPGVIEPAPAELVDEEQLQAVPCVNPAFGSKSRTHPLSLILHGQLSG